LLIVSATRCHHQTPPSLDTFVIIGSVNAGVEGCAFIGRAVRAATRMIKKFVDYEFEMAVDKIKANKQ
jgi:hypothetical protein